MFPKDMVMMILVQVLVQVVEVISRATSNVRVILGPAYKHIAARTAVPYGR